MKTLRIMRLAAGFCLVLFLAVGSLSAEPLKTIKVAHWGHGKILIYAPLYIAMDCGFFEREGLKIQLVYSGNDDQVFATVLSGHAQFGVGDPAFTAISREKGGQGKVVAALVGRVANWAVTKDPSIQPFTDPRRLNGLRVTSFPSPSTTFTILSDIKKNLDLTKMQIVQCAFGSEEAALDHGEADVAIMLEPQTSIAVSHGFRVVWSLANYYGNFALTGVTTTDSYIKKDPETVQRFVNAIQTALTFCAKDPNAAAVVLEKDFPDLPPAIVQSAMKRMVDDQTIPRTAVISSNAWIKTLEIRKEVGDLKSLDVANACLDMKFAEAAVNALPHENLEQPPKHLSETRSSASPSGWVIYGHVADILGILGFLVAVASFAILILGLLEYRKGSNAWNSLSTFQQRRGKIIAGCFANAYDAVSTREILEILTVNHNVPMSEAQKLLATYLKVGLVEKVGNGDNCRPVVTRWIQLVPLFQLHR